MTKIISLTFVNLVTPKARAKHEHLFNKPVNIRPKDSSLFVQSVGNKEKRFKTFFLHLTFTLEGETLMVLSKAPALL